MRRALMIGVAGMYLAAGLAKAEDWPQFQGTGQQGISRETGLLKMWPEGGPRVLWTAALGVGYGGAAVRDGEVYILDRTENSKDALRCLNPATGEELWRYSYDAPGEVPHDGSRSTPTVDRKYVFTIGPFGHVHCIDRGSHEPVWSRHVLSEFGGALPRWGVAQSPVLYRDAVIITPMSKEVGVVALAKATGKELWRGPPLGDLAYVTPRIANLGGVDQLLVVSATRSERPKGAGEKRPAGRPSGAELRKRLRQVKTRVAGVAAADGRVLWSHGDWTCAIPIPNPTPVGEDRVFVTGGYYAGSVMLKIGEKEGKFSASVLFKNEDYGAQVPHPLLYKDHLYMLCNGNFRKNGLVCMDLQGNVKWKTGKEPVLDRGHLLIADGLMYNLDGARGVLRLIEPDPAGYKELAQAELFRGSQLWAPLVLSDGKLFVRGSDELKCLDVRQSP